MKKKIILILSMCALLVCLFVISASASSFSIYTDKEFTILSSDFQFNSVDFCYDSVNDFWLGQVLAYSPTSEYISGIVVINPLSFKSYLNSFNTLEDLHTYANDNYESSTSLTGYLASLSEDQFNYYRNYTEITQDDLTAQYNQGKTDGVTEFKESEEYTNILSLKYEDGKTDGAEAFKSSDEYSQELQAEYTKGYGVGYEAYKDSAEYESALNTQFNLGSSTGVKNYLESEEYSNALQNEYDNGYEAATTEDNQKRAKNMLGTALGISGALIIVLLCVYFFVGRKAKKRR